MNVETEKDCPEPEELSLWLEEAASRRASQRIAQHVESCPVCRQKLDRLRELDRVTSVVLPTAQGLEEKVWARCCEVVPDGKPPLDFRSRVLTRRFYKAAAVAVFLLALGGAASAFLINPDIQRRLFVFGADNDGERQGVEAKGGEGSETVVAEKGGDAPAPTAGLKDVPENPGSDFTESPVFLFGVRRSRAGRLGRPAESVGGVSRVSAKYPSDSSPGTRFLGNPLSAPLFSLPASTPRSNVKHVWVINQGTPDAAVDVLRRVLPSAATIEDKRRVENGEAVNVVINSSELPGLVEQLHSHGLSLVSPDKPQPDKGSSSESSTDEAKRIVYRAFFITSSKLQE